MGADSPPLEPVKFNPGNSPDPISIPALPRPLQQPTPARGTAGKPPKPRRRPIQQTQSDAVIINFLGNHNFPHIAHQAYEDPWLEEGEAEGSPQDDMNGIAGPGAAQLRNTAEHALQRQGSMDGRERSHSKSSAPLDMIMNQDNHHPRPRLDTSDKTLTSLQNTSVGIHMHRLPDLSAGSTEPPSSIIKTPDTSRDLPPIRSLKLINPDRKLPPIPAHYQQSPSSALPSPSSAMAGLQFTSSNKSTPSSAFPHSATSPPRSGLSPPLHVHDSAAMSPPAHPSSLRAVASPQTESTPSSMYSAPSYARSPGESVSSPELAMQLDGVMRPMLPLPTAPGMTSGVVFRCKMPQCTAPPFQTQYLLKSVHSSLPAPRVPFNAQPAPEPHPQTPPLLQVQPRIVPDRDAHPPLLSSFRANPSASSHMNVHSSSRPHYCPIKGCQRSETGRGFKRKNEMIRHGLVHKSPGYMCPFCPDREHKYPRPDNLQRHVKVHHVDKNKDDPVLREVLNQRNEGGGNRGRRKRAGS